MTPKEAADILETVLRASKGKEPEYPLPVPIAALRVAYRVLNETPEPPATDNGLKTRQQGKGGLLLCITQAGDRPPAIHYDLVDDPNLYELWGFDFLGYTQSAREPGYRHISFASPGGGTSFAHLARMALMADDWDYLGFVSHDVHLRMSEVVRMHEDAVRLGLIAYAPSQSADSCNLHPHMANLPGHYWHQVDWVESQTWFLHRSIVHHLLPYCDQSVSGWGIDSHALASVVKRFGHGKRVGVFDYAVSYHAEMNRSGAKLYNGKTAAEEAHDVKFQVWLDERDAGMTTEEFKG